jgi:hypothetical protein
MLFDTKSNIYDVNGYLADGILVKNHYNFNDHIPAIVVQYKRNQKNGFYKTFDEAGRLISDRTFCNGFLHGISKFYDENENLIREDEYDDGRKIKSITYTLAEPQEVPRPKYVRRRYSLSELEG